MLFGETLASVRVCGGGQTKLPCLFPFTILSVPLCWEVSAIGSVILWKCKNNVNERMAKSEIMFYSCMWIYFGTSEHVKRWDRLWQSQAMCDLMSHRWVRWHRYSHGYAEVYNFQFKPTFSMCAPKGNWPEWTYPQFACIRSSVRGVSMQIQSTTFTLSSTLTGWKSGVANVDELNAHVYRVHRLLACHRGAIWKIWNLKRNSSIFIYHSRYFLCGAGELCWCSLTALDTSLLNNWWVQTISPSTEMIILLF